MGKCVCTVKKVCAGSAGAGKMTKKSASLAHPRRFS